MHLKNFSGQFTHIHSPAMSEKLCLKWNDFQDNTNSAFGSLRNDHDFSDVTLACEDGQQVEAHKVILAASSPFFQTLLRRNKHPHPLIYMRGVKSEDLVAIVDFLYYGEANVYQENIDSFLAIAEELNLKGLTRNSDNSENEQETMNMPETKRNKSKARSAVPKVESHPNEEKLIGHDDLYRAPAKPTDTTVAVQNHTVTSVSISDIKELDNMVKSMMTKSTNLLPNGGGMRAEICTVCGKEGKNTNIMSHIEANHLEGVSIPCNYCEKQFRSRNALRQHNKTAH